MPNRVKRTVFYDRASFDLEFSASQIDRRFRPLESSLPLLGANIKHREDRSYQRGLEVLDGTLVASL